MQFRSLEPQEFILLAIEFSLKSVRRFLAMPCHYYSHVKTEFLVCPWVNFNAVQVISSRSESAEGRLSVASIYGIYIV